MSEKPFRFGLMVGRFQTVHLGHEQIIRIASSVCDSVGIFIGSSQESLTMKNPFDYDFRRQMLSSICPDNVLMAPLPDAGLGNNSLWGDYVLDNCLKAFGTKPDIVISGEESRRDSWYEGRNIAVLNLPKTVDVCASRLRQLLLEDRRGEFSQLVSPAIMNFYPRMREITVGNRLTDSTDSI